MTMRISGCQGNLLQVVKTGEINALPRSLILPMMVTNSCARFVRLAHTCTGQDLMAAHRRALNSGQLKAGAAPAEGE